MAKPIKETPILKGDDARKFLSNLESNRDKKVSKEDTIRINENFNRLQAIAKFK